MKEVQIWKPVSFDPAWLRVDTSRFDAVLPEWLEQREAFLRHPEQYGAFIERLKRRQAIETGVIEGLYDLSRGATETLIREGFIESYVGHADSTIPSGQLMDLLQNQFDALDWVFDFIRSDRSLSVGYIKELHALTTRSQRTAEGVDMFGRHFPIPLLHGEFKQKPNNPGKDGMVFLYCPPEQVDSEMDNLIALFHSDIKNAHMIVKAAWLHHVFVTVHPFQDGNGRVARLLASLVLIKENLFPFTLDRVNRKAYIDALETADGGDYQPLVNALMDDQIENMLQSIIYNTAAPELSIFARNVSSAKTIWEYEKERNLFYQYMVERFSSVFDGIDAAQVHKAYMSLLSYLPWN